MCDSIPSTSEFRQRRADSLSSTGPHSTASGYPSPSSAMSGPPGLRTAIASFIPLGTVSPMSTSPMASSVRSEVSVGPHARQSIEPRSARTPPGLGQSHTPISQFDTRDAQLSSIEEASSQESLDPRLPLGQTSPFDRHPRPTHIPHFLQKQHNSGTSSKSSGNSSRSSGSTAPSSIFSSVGVDEGRRTAFSLPPLASVATSSSRSEPASYTQHSSQSPFHASPGMKFESLQLPLPHNIAFGQRPLPRSEHEEKLANIFDLQDVPRERTSLKNMTLDQTLPTLSGPPQPRHPPHRPSLPALDNQSRGNSQENVLLPNANPLSVLAYAGRLVGHEIQRSPSK